MIRKLAAEFIGTALLLCAAVGSATMGQTMGVVTGLGLMAGALTTGGMLFVIITALGPVSGAHFNPVVTLVFRTKGDITSGAAIGYVMAQIAGGIAGVMAVHVMFGLPVMQVSTTARDGYGLIFAEGIATFGLIFTILAGLKARPEAVPAMVGLYVMAGYWFTSSTVFANPAVTIARSLTDTVAGIAPHSAPGWIAAEIAAALLAAVVLPWLLAEE